ncbi:MAG: protoporphyrinogen oxidase [Acidobacteriia bacterium]|nr:protoporphyrinogen oxidase [Terriglobia bacterium]
MIPNPTTATQPATSAATPRLEGLIVGGGISGLSLAHWLGLADRPGGWELWEATERLGGTIGTDRVAGYSIDWGPNGFLDREPLTLQLIEEVGLSEALEPADDSSQKRFIVKHGRLHPVPLSPGAILGTGLLSPRDKVRIFMEPFIAARRDDSDESVFDFAARRIGRGAAESFIDPMVAGIFGGLARELSLPACFPIMREMEQRYGGLVRALLARQFKRRPGGRDGAVRKSSGPAGPGGRLTSFRGGLDILVTRLHERLQAIISINRPAVRIAWSDGMWEVTDQAGRRVRTRNLICACPTFAATQMFEDTDPELSAALRTIRYAPIVVVATGHRREDIAHALDGFGFLIPRSEGLRTLGSIWTSSIFANRAPAGYVQFRSMLGGAGDPDALKLSDEELWRTLRSELGALVGIGSDPAFMRVYRWERAIPQFTLGHIGRRARLEELTRQRPGLHLVGNAFYGVGLNDCVKMAHRIAQEILTPDS